ncbi:MAG: MBL fold metallo-hydrolase [Hoeflea sp.]|uniref:MBL fold metallo-hydrolase n=1 Tax=Hoeflea sp. TaxID=1940281 RepID=UPI003296F30C
MNIANNCVDQCRLVGVEPNNVRHVLQSHLHLDHTGAIGHFPRAWHIVRRSEYAYAFNSQQFAADALHEAVPPGRQQAMGRLTGILLAGASPIRCGLWRSLSWPVRPAVSELAVLESDLSGFCPTKCKWRTRPSWRSGL